MQNRTHTIQNHSFNFVLGNKALRSELLFTNIARTGNMAENLDEKTLSGGYFEPCAGTYVAPRTVPYLNQVRLCFSNATMQYSRKPPVLKLLSAERASDAQHISRHQRSANVRSGVLHPGVGKTPQDLGFCVHARYGVNRGVPQRNFGGFEIPRSPFRSVWEDEHLW